MNWLSKNTRNKNLPRDCSEYEVIKLNEIAELEYEKYDNLEQKIRKFKS